MRNLKSVKISLLAFVLVALAAGCGREQATSPPFPIVTATSPANGATGVILNTTVTASFSSVMAPGTINTTTFTLTGPAGAVAGAVTYSGTTATFTPTVSLAASTLYTGTITTGATDPGGNALAANYVWSFTTGLPTVISTVPAAGATAGPAAYHDPAGHYGLAWRGIAALGGPDRRHRAGAGRLDLVGGAGAGRAPPPGEPAQRNVLDAPAASRAGSSRGH